MGIITSTKTLKCPGLTCALFVLIMLIHAWLLGWIALKNSPTYDEIAHLPAGISHWYFGNFDLYRVNPPLHRMVAAIPVIIAQPTTDWSMIRDTPYSRSEFEVGKAFIKANPDNYFHYFVWARWTCIPFSLLGGWICYLWARDLFGHSSGIAALVLWCACPNILAWGATLTPDVAAASVGAAACYLFWIWTNKPSWAGALVAGLVLGLAELIKSSWIILFVLFPFLWALTLLKKKESSRLIEFLQISVFLVLAVYVINLGYGFHKTGQQLKSFQFASQSLNGTGEDHQMGNRFANSWLGNVPVPLPVDYVLGIDFQKSEFERRKWSYLRGEQKEGGWYTYYLYALAVKTPIGTLVIFGLAMVLSLCSKSYRSHLQNELILIVPTIAVLALVSSQTGFNRYLRYVIPALPFLFIAASRLFRDSTSNRIIFITGFIALSATILSSLYVFPYSFSYFNLLAGGPKNGHQHLADANIDWGQNLHRLKCWMNEHPEASPMHLAYFGYLDPESADIYALQVPSGPTEENKAAHPNSLGPQPGWYAISVNHLINYHHFGPPTKDYSYFQYFEAFDQVGYSIYLYHLERAEVNKVRGDLGLPPLATISPYAERSSNNK